MTQTADGAYEAIRGIGDAGYHGGYREAETALDVLDRMAWFDNFGPEIYRERMWAVVCIVDEHPDLEAEYQDLVDHARDATEVRP
jgi:hypothetical protein